MSGLYPAHTGMLGNDYTHGSYRAKNPDLADHPSIGGFLRRNGYVSLRVSKIFHMGIPTGIETGDVNGVLDGDLDDFVIGYHRWRVSEEQAAPTGA